MSGIQRTELITRLLTVFRQRGFAGATLAQLAQVTELGKASLYHHFPGGKQEMATVLLRHSIAELEQKAFSQLSRHGNPNDRLVSFVDGFSDYVDHGEHNCLIMILGQSQPDETFGRDLPNELSLLIAEQMTDWHERLTQVFEHASAKPKKAARQADRLIAGLYGALALARTRNDPRIFRRLVKGLRRELERS